MAKTQLKDLTEDLEIFYTENGEEKSRVFRLREHSRNELDEFIDLQLEAGRELDQTAKNTEVTEETAADIVRISTHLVYDPFYKVVAYCLRHPVDGGDPPSTDWCKEHVARRKAKFVVDLQEKLDGLDDEGKKKAESVRAVMLAANQVRRYKELGIPSTTGSQTDIP